MSALGNILKHNREFVQSKSYEQFRTDRYPNKKMVIVTCMDTRLVELLPQAMNFRNGDVKIIKIAGAVVAHPFGSVMRSIMVAVYGLQAEEVCIIAHYDCGMNGLKADKMLDAARKRGISDSVLKTLEHAGVDPAAWLSGFDNLEAALTHSVEMIRNHPMLPPDVPVHGLIIDPETGRLDLIDEGYAHKVSGSKKKSRKPASKRGLK